jgi:ketosteroid isomerase-like protein
MAHPFEAVIRAAYAAFGRGNVDGYLRACTEDFEFHVPGHGGISGTYVGRTGLYALAEKAMTITRGTFREEVEDVMANDEHAVVEARHRFRRGAILHDYKTAHLYTIRDGKLARCIEQPRDQDAFDNAWRPERAAGKAKGA